MAVQVGTYDISTLLASRFTSANAFGLSTIAEILAADIAAHNLVVQEMMTEMADITNDIQRIYGSSTGGDMVKVDEYGRSSTQRSIPGATVGFPFERNQFALGWTKRYMEKATPADLAIKTQSAEQAHLRGIRSDIKRAIYVSVNRTFADYLNNGIAVPVKAFVNADGAAIPNGPDGNSFDGATHQHYVGASSLSATNMTALINNVIEHGHGNNIILAFNFNDEATVRAITGFIPAYASTTIAPNNVAVAAMPTNPGNLYNRFLGIFGAAQVWIKPWCIQGYVVCFDTAYPGKPLGFRQDAATTLNGLRIAAELDLYPLYAQYMEADYGVGVWTRTNGAVLDFSHSGTYTDPTSF